LVICSHVLEHVPDDIQALSEIYRVLKKGGVAILMAPINLGLEKSFEAEKDKHYTVSERWKYFGQDDHERLYSKNDFIQRIKSVGFNLEEIE
jgi:ubiquinone/menaquinone biosynthesis C-methylase UbiE